MRRLLLFIFLLTATTNTHAITKAGSPFINMFTRIEWVSDLNDMSSGGTLSVSGLEFFIGGRFYLYTQLNFQYKINFNEHRINDLISYTPYSIGTLVGFGFYLSDNRIDSIGWSSVLNLAGGVKFTIPKKNEMNYDEIPDHIPSVTDGLSKLAIYTVELNFGSRYNFATNFGFQFNFVLGLDIKDTNNLSMRYGFGFGILI